MSQPEAPAVIWIDNEIYDTENNAVGDMEEYIRRDIFDAYKAAVDAWIAWHENELTAETLTPDHLRHDQELHQEAMNLMQAARKAGESVK